MQNYSNSWDDFLYIYTFSILSLSNNKFDLVSLSSDQEQRLQKLQERLQIPFDETRPDHQEALRALWHISFPNVPLKGLISEQWKEMGWQGPNPSTDFRKNKFLL
ncbi:hypothetical protein CRYUN_Cryun10bG0070500 [Craigia yunnanensis]